MRIITGKFKGRRLDSVPDLSIRPAMDKVKVTIFNVLQNRLDLRGARILDLFAGSGSLGFESLSRGAEHVLFVDENSRSLDVIEKNAALLGVLDECTMSQDDAVGFIRRTDDRFDLIFADPPYAYDAVGSLPDLIFSRGLLGNDGFLIIEHTKHALMQSTETYKLVIQKEFGNTRVSFFTHGE